LTPPLKNSATPASLKWCENALPRELLPRRVTNDLLEAVYEQDFLSCSYGFRPGRSAHQLLNQLASVIAVRRQRWLNGLSTVICFG
jgi:hypothetical protein